MRIKQILSQYRNDFTALMECEHCNATSRLGSGYNDAYYHYAVIPAMRCTNCGQDRDGTLQSVADTTTPTEGAGP